MDSGGARQRHRLPAPLLRQILLIASVAGFVDHAHQRAEKLILVVTGGNAHIFRHATAEGMRTDIQPAMVKVETQRFHDAQAELTLSRQGERPLRRDNSLLRLFFHDLL